VERLHLGERKWCVMRESASSLPALIKASERPEFIPPSPRAA
jgi:hypothetical protein